MPVNRNEIKLLANVPVTFKLDRGPEGKEYPSKFENSAPRYMYTVNNDAEFVYLPQVARNQLIRTQAQAGDMIRVLKSVAGDSTNWRVEVLSDANEPATPGPRVVTPAAPRTQGATALSQQQTAKPQPSSAFPQITAGKMAMSLAAEIVAHGLAEAKRLGIPYDFFEDIRCVYSGIMITHDRNQNGGAR